MDPFAIVLLVGTAVLVICLMLLGKYYPGTGADVLDWKPTRSPELEAELEVNDLQQMLEAANERRRRRGQPERTLEQVEMQVATDLREATAKHLEREAGKQGEQDDVEPLLALKNRRRAKTGLEPLTLEQFVAELNAEPPG